MKWRRTGLEHSGRDKYDVKSDPLSKLMKFWVVLVPRTLHHRAETKTHQSFTFLCCNCSYSWPLIHTANIHCMAKQKPYSYVHDKLGFFLLVWIYMKYLMKRYKKNNGSVFIWKTYHTKYNWVYKYEWAWLIVSEWAMLIWPAVMCTDLLKTGLLIWFFIIWCCYSMCMPL